MPLADRRRRARRRAVRLARFLQSWPLWYLAAIPVGLAVGLAGFATGRPAVLRLGTWITMPGFGFLIWLAFTLALAAVVNLGIFAWNVVVRLWGRILHARSGGRR